MYTFYFYENIFLVLSKNLIIFVKNNRFMKLKYFILLTTLLSINAVFSQNNTISGKISTKSNPLAYANVYLKKTKIGTASNENGFYQLKNIPKGNYTLVVSTVGYQTKSIKITVGENENITKNFTLKEDSSLDEIVVSGTLKPVTKSNSPIPVEVYSPTFFKKNPAPSVFESMANVNGVRPQVNCSVCNTGDIHIN